MSEEASRLNQSATGAAETPSLVAEVRQLAADGRTLLEAELAYQKSRAAVAGQSAKGIAGWGALALALVFVALIALVMGLVLTVAELVGPGPATVLVTAGFLLAAALSGWFARSRWARAAALLSDAAKPADE